ncbi:MAG: AAA family ATPase [Lachnospiraceae bacterium]|nr:AAA family ATPase [Lachnospiraceae bacterium]
MAKKIRKGFGITTPDVKTIYIGKGHKQKAKYLQLHADFGRKQFDEDLAAGAKIYGSFTEVLKLNTTRYNLITAPTEEDGLRAVAYLSGIFAEEKGYDDYELDEGFYEDGSYKKEIDLEDPEYTFDDDELWEDDNYETYQESFDRIPIINISDLESDDNTNNKGFGFGVFNMELQNNGRREKPWWTDCCDHSVCIIKNCYSFGYGPFSPTKLMPPEIDSLKRFSGNENVFVVVISKDMPEDDFSITTAALEYTANSFRVEDKEPVKAAYYRKLLEDVAWRRGFSFSKEVDMELLADKLGRINREYPCREYEKIMDYLIHIDAPKRLKSDCFDRLGLDKLINKLSSGRTDRTLEAELAGMEDVKKQIHNIMNMLRYVRLREARGIKNQGFHNVHLFLGAPGTAKTTVAKMLASMMQREGLINGDRFVSLTGAQLKGTYVGQTAPKVHALFQEYDAIFIDEAYSLACSSEGEGGMDSYSQEALAQLAVELEEHATDKLIIFAGYGGRSVSKKNNLMHKFLKSNPGISSRINSTVYFASYAPEDMVEIVHRLADLSSIKLSDKNDEEIAAYFGTRQNEADFGNGREARVFLEYCERMVAERIAGKDPDSLSDKELNTVTGEDIRYTIEALKKKRTNEMGQFGQRFGFL